MRWLVVGPYPPERGSGAEEAAAFVAERLVAGDSVHAVSPRPTAAHGHHALDGLRGLKVLWSIARAEQAEGLWLRVESGIVLRAGIDQKQALVERAAFALFLRRFDTTVLDVGDVGLLPGGRAGRPVLSAASRLVVRREHDAAALLANGAPAERIEQRLADRELAAPASAPQPWAIRAPAADPVAYPPATSLEGLPADRAVIEAAVRTRAVELAGARAAATTREAAIRSALPTGESGGG